MDPIKNKDSTYVRPQIISYTNAEIVKKLGPAYTLTMCSNPLPS